MSRLGADPRWKAMWRFLRTWVTHNHKIYYTYVLATACGVYNLWWNILIGYYRERNADVSSIYPIYHKIISSFINTYVNLIYSISFYLYEQLITHRNLTYLFIYQLFSCTYHICLINYRDLSLGPSKLKRNTKPQSHQRRMMMMRKKTSELINSHYSSENYHALIEFKG